MESVIKINGSVLHNKVDDRIEIVSGEKIFTLGKYRKELFSILKQLEKGKSIDINDCKKELIVLLNELNSKNIIKLYSNTYIDTMEEKIFDYYWSAYSGLKPEECLNKLGEIRVTVLGCGGIGGVVAEQLCRSGVKKYHLIDFDVVCKSNLNRQIVYTKLDIGKKKTLSLKKRLLCISPEVDITISEAKIDSYSSLETHLTKTPVDLLVCGIDTPPILYKKWISKFSLVKGVDTVFGSVGIKTGIVGPLLTKASAKIRYLNMHKEMENKYCVSSMNIVSGSTCATNMLVASLISHEILKYLTDGKSNINESVLELSLDSYKIQKILVK